MRWLLQGLESALESDWIVPVSLGILISFDRLDWLTGFVALIAYANLSERQKTRHD